MTPDQVLIGDTIWAKTRRADDTHVGGMVTDMGISDDGEPYFVVLNDETSKLCIQRMGAKSMTPIRVVSVRRMFYGDVDWTIPKNEREAARMIGWARKCWATAGIKGGDIGPVDEDLMAAAASLRNEVRAMQTPRALNAS